MRASIKLLITSFILISHGCDNNNNNSENYKEITALPRLEWISYARSKDFYTRLELYDEIYNQAGHPHDTYLARSFDDLGYREIEILISKISSKDDFVRYLPIILSIDRNEGYSICKSDQIYELKEKLIEISLYDELRNTKISDCKL